MLKTSLKLLFSLLLAGLFLWFAFANVNWQALLNTLKNITLGGLLAAVPILILSCIIRAWRWRLLLAPISKDIGLSAAFKAVLVAYAGNNVFPRAGEIARIFSLTRSHALPFGAVVATVVVERLLDMLALLLLFAIVLFFTRNQMAQAFPGLETVGLIALMAILVILIGLVVLSFYGDKGLTKIEMTLQSLLPTLAHKLVNMIRAFLQGIKSVRTVEGYIGLFISTGLLNICYLLSVYFPFYSFGFPEQYHLGLFDSLVVMVIASVGIVIPTPGGTGTYHFFCSKTLLIFYRIPEPQALAFATAVHGIAFLTFLIFGGPSLLRLLWVQKKETQEIPAPPNKIDGTNT